MIKALCTTATEVLKNQPSFVEVQPPVNICGDIHGQFPDLLRIFNTVGFPPAKNFLFLGGKFFIKLLISDLSYGIFFLQITWTVADKALKLLFCSSPTKCAIRTISSSCVAIMV